MMYSLGIDVGTSALKAALFDETGTALSSSAKEYELLCPCGGYAEQRPEDWWLACCSAIKTVLKHAEVRPEQIAAVGLSGQMHGLVMLDKNGAVLRNSILWCDLRTQPQCEEIERTVGKERLVEITANRAAAAFTAAKLLWVRSNEEHIYDKCSHIMLPKDYIRYRLTGEIATDVSDAGGTQLLDVEKRTWSGEVADKLHIDKSLLPKVYESVEISGLVSRTASEATGLSIGTIVVAGGGDNACSAIGTGVCSDGKAFTTIGTSGVVFVHTSKMLRDKEGRMHTFCAAVPNEWHVMGVTQAAGLSLKWFCENFCEGEKARAASLGEDIYALTDALAAASPIGARGVLYLPYLNGERTPHFDTAVRGAFLNIGADTERGDFIRAVMEGVAFSLRDCIEVLRASGADIRDMAVCGGGAKSALWRQIIASNYKCPLKRTTSSEGGALGAAILALVGAGAYKNVAEGCESCIRVKDETKPLCADEYEPYYAKYTAGYKRVK
ncbi:MAG: xylulokinase [Clostridia bacterium]|nr:xylulokinase [Clostridia bacterium]